MFTPQFRKPSLYFKLPSEGKNYPENSLELLPNGEIPIYPATALDDIATKTVDGLFNGVATIEVLKSCVPSITDPWQIPITDLEPLLIAVRLATFGNGMDIETVCPKCSETSKYGLNLSNMLNQIKVGNYDENLDCDGVYVKFRPLKYIEHNKFSIQEFQLQKLLNSVENIKDNLARAIKNKEIIMAMFDMQNERISTSVEFVIADKEMVTEKEYIIEYLENCKISTYTKIKEKFNSLVKSSESKPLNVKCMACNYEYDQQLILNYCNYFRYNLLFKSPDEISSYIDELEKDVLSIKENAMKMSWYMRGGISYNEILHLTEKEREFIGKLIEENLETTKKTQLPFF